MRIIDTGDTILTGDNHPQLKIGSELFLVDDRKSTWDKIQAIQEDETAENKDIQILTLALGAENMKKLNKLMENGEISLSGFMNLTFHVMAAITGEDFDELKKAAKERKN